jgi:hypothetical protein
MRQYVTNNSLFFCFIYNINEFRSADFGKYLLDSKMVAAGKENSACSVLHEVQVSEIKAPVHGIVTS